MSDSSGRGAIGRSRMSRLRPRAGRVGPVGRRARAREFETTHKTTVARQAPQLATTRHQTSTSALVTVFRSMHHRLSLLARTPSFQPVASTSTTTSTAHLARPLVRHRPTPHTTSTTTPPRRHLASAAYGAQSGIKWDDSPPEPPFVEADWEPVLAQVPATDEGAVAAWERELESSMDRHFDHEDDFGGDGGSERASSILDKGKGRAMDLPRGEPARAPGDHNQTADLPKPSSKPLKPEIIIHEDHSSQPATRSPDLIANTLINPYSPAPPPPSLDPSPATPLQPHQVPLTSRYDWRLSSPLRRPSRTRPSAPPPLWAPTSLALQGHNRFVGVGVEPARTARGGAAIRREEAWGWKVKVPESERGEWASADAYRLRSVLGWIGWDAGAYGGGGDWRVSVC